MAAWNRFNLPIIQWMDGTAGAVTSPLPGAGWKLFFYESDGTDGGATTTPQDTYTNAALSTPNANPVVANSTGSFPPIFLANLYYNVLLTDENGDTNNPIWSANPVSVFIDDDPAAVSYYDLAVFINSKPANSETYPIYNVPRTLMLPADLVGSIFTVDAGTLPTATATFTIYKTGVSIGTIAFATDGTPTVTFASDVTFNTGDQFSMTAPSSQDATMNFIAMTFVFTVV